MQYNSITVIPPPHFHGRKQPHLASLGSLGSDGTVDEYNSFNQRIFYARKVQCVNWLLSGEND